VTLKVEDVPLHDLEHAMDDLDLEIRDARET
jgi:hypothetical protein